MRDGLFRVVLLAVADEVACEFPISAAAIDLACSACGRLAPGVRRGQRARHKAAAGSRDIDLRASTSTSFHQ